MGPVKVEAVMSAPPKGRISVECGLRDGELMKQIPGATWDDDNRVWWTRLSWSAMVQLRGVFKERLEIGPQLWAMAQQVKAARVDPAMQLRTQADYELDARLDEWCADARKLLSPLQKVGAGFGAASYSSLNCDPQGSGKTPETIIGLAEMLSHGVDPFPVLVVGPNSAKYHWRNEFAKWWPEVDVSVVDGSAKKRREALEVGHQVYVMNWESVRSHSRLAGYGKIKLSDKDKEMKELNPKDEEHVTPRTVIADEVHRAKDPKSKQTRALWYVADRAEHRFGLTGTPVANSPEDLWAVMRFVAPDEWPTKSRWVDRYGLLSWNFKGGLDVVGLKGETREELFKFLDPRMIRRPREIILPELEGKLPPEVRIVDLGSKQRKAYDAFRKEMLAELEGGVLMAKSPMVRFGRLRTLCLATGKIDEGNELQLSAPSAKFDEVLGIIKDADPDEQYAIYMESAKGARILHDQLSAAKVPVGLYSGDTDVKDREEMREAFQDRDHELRALVITYGVGAEGINLSQADALIFVERSPSKIKDSQAEERPMRHGRLGPLRVYDIVAHDTVDERVHEILTKKTGMLEEVTRDAELLKQWLS